MLLGVLPAAHAAEIAVGGVVLDAQQRAIAGASIEILRLPSVYAEARAQFEGRDPAAPVATAVSDAQGRFLAGVPEPGLWRLRVRARGFLPQQLEAVPVVEAAELPPMRLAPATPIRVRVVDERGGPVAGARVTAASPGKDASRRLLLAFAAWSPAPRLAVTGRDGTASIPGGEPGLVLTAIASGYLETTHEDLDGDPVTLRLIRGCRRGFTVVDARQQPAAGVLVLAGRWPVAVTDATGRAEAIIPCGGEQALVLATADGRRVREVLRHTSGSVDDVRFELPPAAAELVGKVLDASTRQPLTGALVWPADAPAAFTRSDLQGRYRVRPPVSREAPLVATMDGASLAFDDLVQPGSGPTFYLRSAPSVVVQAIDEAGRPVAGAETRVSTNLATFFARSDARGSARLKLFGMTDPAELWTTHPDFLPVKSLLGSLAVREGRTVKVVLRRPVPASARVVGQDGEPIAGAEGILAPWPESGPAAGEKPRAVSDDRGLLAFTGLSPGSYDLLVRAAGRAPLHAPGVTVGAAAGARDLGVFRLEAGAVIEGRVVDARDRPIAAVRIDAQDALHGIENEVATDADGRFSMIRAGGSTTMLAVVKPGFRWKSLAVEAPTREPLTIVLERTRRVSGSIRDERGNPVSRANLDLRRAGMPPVLGVAKADDADGRFELEAQTAGAALLAIAAPGYVPKEVAVEVPAEGDVENLEIVLQTAPASVVGQVRGPDGEPIAQTSVWVRSKDPTVRSSVLAFTPRTDSSGSYRAEGLDEGVWSFFVQEPGYVQAQQDVEVRAGENRLDIRLERGLEVAGEVVDAAGEPISGVSLSLTANSPYVGLHALSDDSGRFVLRGVKPGDYTFDARSKGYLSATMPVSVTASSVSGLRIVLDRGGALRGRVLGLPARDLVMAQVVHQPPSAPGVARVDARGEYEIRGLPPGEYTVSARTFSGRSVQATVSLPADSREAVCDLEFPPGLTLSGKLWQRVGPLRAAFVKARSASSNRSAVVNQNGGFRLEGLEPGAYKVEAVDSDFKLLGVHELELSSDRYVEIELTDRPEG